MYTASATKLSVTHTGAKAGTTYYYKVQAINEDNAAENSEYSNVVTCACDLARPTVSVTNVASTGKPKISWKAVAGADQYYVYRSTTKDGTYTKMYTASATKLSVTHIGAVAGTTYYYKVKAVCADNSEANSANSVAVSTVCDLKKPTASVTVLSTGKPKISWKKVDRADKYYVYRSTSGKSGTFYKMYTASATKLSVTHTGAKKGTTYYYMVRAVDADKSSANSANSNIVKATCKK